MNNPETHNRRSEYYRVDRWDQRRMTWEINGHSFATEELARDDYEKRKTHYVWRIVRITQEIVGPLGGEVRPWLGGDLNFGDVGP